MKNSILKSPLLWIFVGAFLLRVIGVDWGLPNASRAFSLHPDEPVNLLYARQIIPGKLDFTPGFYNYGTLYLTLLRIVSDVVGTYAGGFDTNGNLTPAAMGQIHLAGRLLNCVFGAGLAAVTFLIGTRFLRPVGAVVAGALVGVAPALVVHSRFQTVDMLAALLALLSIFFTVRLLDDESPFLKTVTIAGVFAGLSAGTKYVGFVAVLILIPAIWFRDKSQLAKGFLVAVAACLGAFVLSTPGAVLDREAFMRDFLFELNHSKEGHGLVFVGTSAAPIYHLGNLASGFSLFALVTGFAGLVIAVARREKVAVLVGLFFVLYFLAVSGGQIKFMRYILPTIPALALGVGFVLHRLEETEKNRFAILAGIVLVGGLDRGALNGSLVYSMVMKTPDARDTAGKWLKEQNAKTVGVATDPWFWSVTLHPEMQATRMIGRKRLLEMWKNWDNPKVIRFVTENPDETPDWDPRILTEGKPEYVVFTSLEYASVDRIAQMKHIDPHYQELVERYKQFIKKLGDSYTAVQSGDLTHVPMVEDMEYIRPRVVIWKKNAN
jgi:hypothetical protein